ncbi:MAG: glycine cleavage system protein GcvH [Deltaproteobacteria bacterium]|nr:glycine cleavage system protein GcvH [Deltaproteobacteria bacterium]
MYFPDNLLYHPEHTWVRVEGDRATVGITDHAQKALGDVVFVELPKVGRRLTSGGGFGSVESTKSVSELFSPVAGEVVEVNASLEDAPEAINDDPYGAGWMIAVRLESEFDASGLLEAEAYRVRVSEGAADSE